MMYLRLMGFILFFLVIYMFMMIGILNVVIDCKPWFNSSESGCITVQQFLRGK